MKEHKVGEIFKHKGDNIKIIECPECIDCIFLDGMACSIDGVKSIEPCSRIIREDRKSIIFVKVK